MQPPRKDQVHFTITSKGISD